VSVKQVRYSVDDDSTIKLTDSDLKVANSTGKILFDRQLGTIVRHQVMIHVTGTITFVGPNGDVPAELDLTMETDTTRK
jgi:hypothetical protein